MKIKLFGYATIEVRLQREAKDALAHGQVETFENLAEHVCLLPSAKPNVTFALDSADQNIALTREQSGTCQVD